MTVYEEVSRQHEFVDRFGQLNESNGVDVIIPLLHATPFWRQNLFSYFREIPINRLLIGDAGTIDGSGEIARPFPRTSVFDHRHLKTLGKSIATLVAEVETEHFIYLQSDTFLPTNWFDTMWKGTGRFDWFGCPESPLVVMSAPPKDYSGERPMPGTQLGRTAVFKGLNDFIDDDFGYRQEDFILEEFVLGRGGKVGAIHETFHVHQITERLTIGKKLLAKSITIERPADEDDSRVMETQLFGLIKYCRPNRPTILRAAREALMELVKENPKVIAQVKEFARINNLEWASVIPRLGRRVKITLVYIKLMDIFSQLHSSILRKLKSWIFRWH